MYELKIQDSFAAAHNLRGYKGKCEELHGHNWKIEVSVASDRLNREGVVIDFTLLKQKVEKILKTLDHTFLNDHPYYSRKEPSSENIAKYIFDRLKAELKGYHVVLKEVTAWESESSCATYSGR